MRIHLFLMNASNLIEFSSQESILLVVLILHISINVSRKPIDVDRHSRRVKANFKTLDLIKIQNKKFKNTRDSPNYFNCKHQSNSFFLHHRVPRATRV